MGSYDNHSKWQSMTVLCNLHSGFNQPLRAISTVENLLLQQHQLSSSVKYGKYSLRSSHASLLHMSSMTIKYLLNLRLLCNIPRSFDDPTTDMEVIDDKRIIEYFGSKCSLT